VARIHLFEVGDMGWCPRWLHDGMRAYLNFAMGLGGQLAPIASWVGESLARAGERRILDMASGGGGPALAIVDLLASEGVEVTAELSDLRPVEGVSAWIRERSGGRASYLETPVDATAVAQEREGLRTMFNAFHHFPPDVARGVLASAAAANRPIAVVEMVSRPQIPFIALLAPVMTAIAVPFLRPFRWSWLPFTYLLPLLPAVVAWDGIVSCLRIYSPDELRAMTEGLGDPGYIWEITEIPIGPGAKATALLGLPAK
jgi:hypothetical protein